MAQANFFQGSAVVTWLGFAMTFIARPFGGVVLGMVGDLFGRKARYENMPIFWGGLDDSQESRGKKRGGIQVWLQYVYIYIVIYSDIYILYTMCVDMYLYIIYYMCTHTHTHLYIYIYICCMHIIYLISIPGPSKEPDICVKFRCVTEFPCTVSKTYSF